MYLDSAIVVKLIVREADSDWFAHVLKGHSFDTSELALMEVQAALLFKERAGDITARERVDATKADMEPRSGEHVQAVRDGPIHLTNSAPFGQRDQR